MAWQPRVLCVTLNLSVNRRMRDNRKHVAAREGFNSRAVAALGCVHGIGRRAARRCCRSPGDQRAVGLAMAQTLAHARPFGRCGVEPPTWLRSLQAERVPSTRSAALDQRPQPLGFRIRYRAMDRASCRQRDRGPLWNHNEPSVLNRWLRWRGITPQVPPRLAQRR